MSEKTRTGLAALAGGLVLGALGDALLNVSPWGIGLPFWVGALGLTLLLLVRLYPGVHVTNRLPLLAPAVCFAIAFAWRDSRTLQSANLLAVVILLALTTCFAADFQLRASGVVSYLIEIIAVLCRSSLGLIGVLPDISWSEIPRSERSEAGARVGRGLLISIPLVLVFGGLMMSADAVFNNLVLRAFDWDFANIVSHLTVFAVFAWFAGGYLRGLFDKRERPAVFDAPSLQKYTVEGAVVLGVMVALFASFVVVQIRYLFGGSTHLAETAGLTYAQYARRGFFELVWIAALSLPMLLGAHSAMVDVNGRGKRTYAVLAGAMIALVFVIVASALKRMNLYVNAYGLTELRLFTTAFMLWLVVVFGWMSVTVLAGRRPRFAVGAFIAAFVVLAALNLADPDALIVRTNVSRPDRAERFDAAYASDLSADAVPALIAALPSLPDGKRAEAANGILERWGNIGRADWRTWSYGRARAVRVVADSRAMLMATKDLAPPAEIFGPPAPRATADTRKRG